ncbi:thiamine pyrophosphate-binding protein [Chryseobacterium sp. DT-3]|uniref:thiamine pyrophosphate-binding protein n=1 Tax=Chryseobacterium sp. DT-3 TaxID=3396164 RepID=UPI003F1AE899
MAKNIAEQIVEMLENANVKRIYAVTGDSLNHLNIAVKKSSIEWIHVRHEEVGAYAEKQILISLMNNWHFMTK